VSNVLSEEKKKQIIALGQLGWSLRRIEKATGVRRETAGEYLKAADIAVRPPGAWGKGAPAKPANGVTTDSELPAMAKPANEVTTDSSGAASACEPVSRIHRARRRVWPQCHGDLAGTGGSARFSWLL
jgi:hypothetical protein